MPVRDPDLDGGRLKRADVNHLKEIFDKYASIEKDGEKFMTPSDFIYHYLQINCCNEDSLNLLAGIADTDKDGLINYQEFRNFEDLLCYPDALFKTTFRLFDLNNDGLISFSEFKDVVTKTILHQKILFNMESNFIQLYFGRNKQRSIPYSEFSQFIHDFNEEYALEGFRRADKDGSGFITIKNFQHIMEETKSHLLTDKVRLQLTEMTEKVSFAYFTAFNDLLNNMELVKRIYLNCSNDSKTQSVTKEELMHSAQVMSQMTPLQIDILFQLCGAIHENKTIVYEDLNSIAPEWYYKEITMRLAEIIAVASPEDRSSFTRLFEAAYRFSLGGIAGAIGVIAVYPIDLVKTLIQNERKSFNTRSVMYKNSFDCFQKVIKNEGIFGIYRGLLPQLIGVTPEKALKLTINDAVRDVFYDKDGHIPLYGEIIAGFSAGVYQVILSNPVEIVKIRLQTAGRQKLGAWEVLKQLGIKGLSKGWRACLLRDSVFSAIYFPTYSYLKITLADRNGYNNPGTLLLAAFTAGIPASATVTPADVIKTRLQVTPVKGQTTYTGVIDAARKIYKEEGLAAFWKGVVPRIIRSSSQFGVTLFMYEILQRFFFVDFAGTKPSGSVKKVAGGLETDQRSKLPDHIGGYSIASPIFHGMETKFGFCLPKFGTNMSSCNEK